MRERWTLKAGTPEINLGVGIVTEAVEVVTRKTRFPLSATACSEFENMDKDQRRISGVPLYFYMRTEEDGSVTIGFWPVPDKDMSLWIYLVKTSK